MDCYERNRCIAMTRAQILAILEQHANAQAVQSMAKFGSRPAHALGISIPTLRKIARETGRNHSLAIELWSTGIHEARILASMIAEPQLVSPHQKAVEWCHRELEFVRRAGFVMMAELAVHDKQAPDEAFLPFFPLIQQYAIDERNFVKKAVNWALRQIGKRNSNLRVLAIERAETIAQIDSKAARWIAKDALKELKMFEDMSRR